MSVLSACDLTSMVQASKCFDCLDKTAKQSLRVYFLAQALKANGGADLTDQTTRNKVVSCLACAVPDFRMDSMLTAVDQKLAAALGASVDLTIAQLRAKVPCSGCGNQDLNKAAELYLRCALALRGV